MENGITEITEGIWRATFSLPLGIDHVHCYVLRADDGTLTIVDTGLGLPDAEDRWRAMLRQIPGRAERIVITHFHPDHVGAAAEVATVTGAPVYQGTLDYAQCVRAWGAPAARGRFTDYLLAHGMPRAEVEAFHGMGEALRQSVHFVRDPEPLEPGDRIVEWDVVHLPGHADGHLALLSDGVLIAGDALLGTISPNVGLYPDSRPDPLGDYLGSLARIVELAPRLALAGHGEAMDDPVARAHELTRHHEERLDLTVRALDGGPLNAYETSLALFPEPLPPALRRFALAEARAHLERLVVTGRAVRVEGDGGLEYAAP